VAVLGAQQTPSATKGTKVTVAGCIEQAAPAKPTGTSGDVETAVPDTKFVLTTSVTGTASGTAGTSAPTSKVLYRLDDADQAKVSAHEGHKVEITGTVKDESQPTQSAEQDETHPSSPVQTPKLSVESVKMIAESCSQK
jgi:hypothetical protein